MNRDTRSGFVSGFGRIAGAGAFERAGASAVLGEPGVQVVYATDATAHHCTALYRQFRQPGTHVRKEAEHAAYALLAHWDHVE